MEKQAFFDFCDEQFTKRGFKKRRKQYFLSGDEVLCTLQLYGSLYGPNYTVCAYYHIGHFEDPKAYPRRDECDVILFLNVLSKTTDKGKYYLTCGIDYEEYTAEELIPFFNQFFEEYVFPSLLEGKKRLYEIVKEPYSKYGCTNALKNKQEILQKLLSD